MDCITCHNRAAHNILSPSANMDVLLGRGLVSPTIPDIHKLGSQAIGNPYTSQEQGYAAIAGLEVYYQTYYADFYAKNTALVKTAVAAIREVYTNSVLVDQKMDWTVHPDNMQHKDFPGCMRCHANGKDTVRLECNLCHSIPTVSTAFQLVAEIPVVKGFEPENHKNPNWINLHRVTFDNTCKSCHTVEEPGGVSNKSFCSNSICHGSSWKFAGFDAPKLREVLQSQMPTATPIPTITPTALPKPTQPAGQPTTAPTPAGPLTFAQIGPIFEAKCNACHGEAAIKGLNLTTYAKAMAGSTSGPVIIAGKPDDSPLIKVQSGNHPGQVSPAELDLLKKWITAGAPEK
jgi:cytochrome c5